MSDRHSKLLAPEILLRVIADILMLNLCVVTALVIRFFYTLLFEPLADVTYEAYFWYLLGRYGHIAWLLTTICILIFALSGFYTYGRAYQGRYKALVVTQAVSLVYLIFGFLSYFLGGALYIARGALVIAWAISVPVFVFSRIWSWLWVNVVKARPAVEQPNKEVRRVLVIGGAGYIGSGLLPKLLDKGYQVRLLDLLIYGTETIDDLLKYPNLEVLQADFRQVDKVVEAMRGVDAVIHLGAIVGDPACALDEELTIEVNLMATRMIAEVAKGSGVSRFIFASTCSVYGANEILLDERSALHPVSIYARSKIASERVLMSMASTEFAPTMLRFGTIYGLSGRTRFDLVVNLLTAKALKEGEITIFGGNQWRPFVHVDDAALAVLNVLEAPVGLVGKEIFNVGSDEQNYTIRQVGEMIKQMVPSARLVSKGEDADKRDYKVSFAKINRILAFKPQWTLAQGIEQVIDAMQSGKVIDYQDARYSNVKFLSDEANSHLVRGYHRWAHDLINQETPEVLVAGKDL
ncbi:MAG: NAD(P)-dependent oxidoreductase [Acidobacteriota bacterium]